jgi:hypothetical protein
MLLHTLNSFGCFDARLSGAESHPNVRKSKRRLILASFAIAIPPLLSAATPSERTSAAILSPPSRASVFGLAGAGSVSASPRISSDPSEGSDFLNVKQAVPAAAKRYSADSAGNRRVRFYREAETAIDHQNFPVSPYLSVIDLGRGFQVRAIGAPISPIEGENTGERLQARFPILSVAW